MILEEIMSHEVITLTEKNTIQEAVETMRQHRIRHLPITDENNHLVGLVSNQDLRDATPSIFRSTYHQDDLQKPLSSIMKTNLITAHPLDFVEDIAIIFYENHIGCVPILQENKLVGIITKTDVLHTFVKLTGAHQPGSQIQVKVPNKTGMLHDVVAIFKEKKVNILSVLVYPNTQDDQYKILVFRVQTMNPLQLISELKGHGHKVIWSEELESQS